MQELVLCSSDQLSARVAQWQRNRLVIGRLVGSTPLSGFAQHTERCRSG